MIDRFCSVVGNRIVSHSIKAISANLSLEHPRRCVDEWFRVLFCEESYDIVALQECLNADGTNVASQLQDLLFERDRNDFDRYGERIRRENLTNCTRSSEMRKNRTYVLTIQDDVAGNRQDDGDQAVFIEKSLFEELCSASGGERGREHGEGGERGKCALRVASVHLSHGPYIPHLLRDGVIQHNQVYDVSREFRELELYMCLDQVSNAENTIILGDFNEPSHLDFGVSSENDDFVAKTDCNGIKFDEISRNFYCSNELERIGFNDCFYASNINRNEANFASFSRTSHISTFPASLYDDLAERIDFIYFRGRNLRCTSYRRIDTGLSDHFAIACDFIFE